MDNRFLRWTALLFLMLAARSRVVQAQAWTPEARTLNVDASYQLGYATRTESVNISVIHHYLIPAVEYGITDKLAISASLPLIAVKCPECPTLDGGSHAHGAYDDGRYHETPTDLRVSARYRIPVAFLNITPQIGASAPVRRYEWAGNASAGRRLNAAYFGLNIGADLDEHIPRTALHLAYEFALVERFTLAGAEGKAIDENYSTIAGQVEHRIGGLHLHAGADYLIHHGGITFAEFSQLTSLERLNHDPILREKILMVGGGLAYDISDATTLYASTRIFVAGSNTSNASIFAVGASWDIDL